MNVTFMIHVYHELAMLRSYKLRCEQSDLMQLIPLPSPYKVLYKVLVAYRPLRTCKGITQQHQDNIKGTLALLRAAKYSKRSDCCHYFSVILVLRT